MMLVLKLLQLRFRLEVGRPGGWPYALLRWLFGLLLILPLMTITSTPERFKEPVLHPIVLLGFCSLMVGLRAVTAWTGIGWVAGAQQPPRKGFNGLYRPLPVTWRHLAAGSVILWSLMFATGTFILTLLPRDPWLIGSFRGFPGFYVVGLSSILFASRAVAIDPVRGRPDFTLWAMSAFALVFAVAVSPIPNTLLARVLFGLSVAIGLWVFPDRWLSFKWDKSARPESPAVEFFSPPTTRRPLLHMQWLWLRSQWIFVLVWIAIQIGVFGPGARSGFILDGLLPLFCGLQVGAAITHYPAYRRVLSRLPLAPAAVRRDSGRFAFLVATPIVVVGFGEYFLRPLLQPGVVVPSVVLVTTVVFFAIVAASIFSASGPEGTTSWLPIANIVLIFYLIFARYDPMFQSTTLFLAMIAFQAIGVFFVAKAMGKRQLWKVR